VAFLDKFWIFENFFDMPIGLLCARIVDCLDNQVFLCVNCISHHNIEYIALYSLALIVINDGWIFISANYWI